MPIDPAEHAPVADSPVSSQRRSAPTGQVPRQSGIATPRRRLRCRSSSAALNHELSSSRRAYRTRAKPARRGAPSLERHCPDRTAATHRNDRVSQLLSSPAAAFCGCENPSWRRAPEATAKTTPRPRALRMRGLETLANDAGMDDETYLLDFDVPSLYPHTSVVHAKNFARSPFPASA
jgi:hypothetical protein